MSDEQASKHGLSGYRRGCKCETCRAAKREYMRTWRARRRTETAAVEQETKAIAALDPLQPVPSLDLDAAPGVVESALRKDIKALTGEPPWKRTLAKIALLNARLLDQAPRIDRLDLISPIELRTLEVLNRLRAVSAGGSVADDAARLLEDMARGAGGSGGAA